MEEPVTPRTDRQARPGYRNSDILPTFAYTDIEERTFDHPTSPTSGWESRIVASFALHYFEDTDEVVLMRDDIEVFRTEVGE